MSGHSGFGVRSVFDRMIRNSISQWGGLIHAVTGSSKHKHDAAPDTFSYPAGLVELDDGATMGLQADGADLRR
jgi:hypothetical protein